MKKRLVGLEESELFERHYEADSTDAVVSTCYRLIRSFERATGPEQKIKSISRETLARSLREIADRAFALAWNRRDLTGIQRAQILDILLTVASLSDAAKYRLQDSVDEKEDAGKRARKAGA